MKPILWLLLSASLSAAEAPRLADLAFLSGAWRGTLGETLIEEHWMAPEGDAMLGMYREAEQGKTGTTELCAIWHRAEGPVLILRHYAPGLIAREEKDKPLEFALISAAPNRAVFQMPDTKTKLTYERTGDRELIVTLEKEGRKPMRFAYTRQ